MCCPTLAELPSPPPGKSGWPWTEESPQLPESLPDGQPWPKISIVTPSYNQGQFIEETIRSVLLQGYPNLEYIIIDGGSKDESVEIIRKYEPWLSYWVSEKDRGQSHAINNGFGQGSGDILAWLNSDDLYLPGTLKEISCYLLQHPQVAMVYGGCLNIDADSREMGDWQSSDFALESLLTDNFIPQPTAFFKSRVLFAVGNIKEDLHYTMDYDLWIRIGVSHAVSRIDQRLACHRWHLLAKEVSAFAKLHKEKRQMLRDIFADGIFPRDIQNRESHIIAVHALQASVDMLAVGDRDEAWQSLQEVAKTDPTLKLHTPAWTHWVVKRVLRHAPSTSDQLIEEFRTLCLPFYGDDKMTWSRIKRRARLIAMSRKLLSSHKFSMLTDILLTLITDLRWAINRQVTPHLVRRLLGPNIFNVLHKSITLLRQGKFVQSR